jgi:hypothetical protein
MGLRYVLGEYEATEMSSRFLRYILEVAEECLRSSRGG